MRAPKEAPFPRNLGLEQTQSLDALARVIVTHGQAGSAHADSLKEKLALNRLIKSEDKKTARYVCANSKGPDSTHN